MDLVNLDCVILAQRPKMAPHIDNMRAQIATQLDVSIGCISVKAKTGEGLGSVGTGAAIAAHVVVLVQRI